MITKNFESYFEDWIKAQSFPPGKSKALLSASQLFSQRGYDATSTAQIAKHAWVSEATIFKYFKTKKELLATVLAPMSDNLIPTIQNDFFKEFQKQTFTSAEELLNAMVADRVDYFRRNQQIAPILFDQLLVNQPFREAIRTRIQNILTDPNYDLNQSFQDHFGNLIPKSVSFQLILINLMRLLLGYFLQTTVLASFEQSDWDHEIDVLTQQLMITLPEK